MFPFDSFIHMVNNSVSSYATFCEEFSPFDVDALELTPSVVIEFSPFDMLTDAVKTSETPWGPPDVHDRTRTDGIDVCFQEKEFNDRCLQTGLS